MPGVRKRLIVLVGLGFVLAGCGTDAALESQAHSSYCHHYNLLAADNFGDQSESAQVLAYAANLTNDADAYQHAGDQTASDALRAAAADLAREAYALASSQAVGGTVSVAAAQSAWQSASNAFHEDMKRLPTGC